MEALYVKAAAVYFLVGTVLGLVMGSSEQFQYTSLHAHINLLGWASLAIIGVVYRVFPEAGASGMARVQFWLHNIGLLLLAIGMIFFALQNDGGIPFAIVGGLLVIASVTVFVVNLFTRIR